ncbi:MAG: TonB-dependent receptor [Sulfurovum sp.]
MTKTTLSLVVATILTTNAYAEEILEDIEVISTNKTAQSISDTTSDITVITADDIEERGYLSVAEAIGKIAGISVANSGGLGQTSSLFVRGADLGKVLVLIDGMRLNDPSTTDGRAFLENLTTANISQIEVIKGGQSSIWGSNASAGVINIITKEAKNGVHGSIGLKYGSYATVGTDIALSFKNDKLMAQIMGSYLQTDGISALAPHDSEKDAYKNTNYNIKLGYIFDENNQIKVSYNYLKSDIDYDVTLATDPLSNIKNEQKNIALNYQFRYNNYSAVLSASRGEYDREAINSFGVSNFESEIAEYSLINSLSYGTNRVILGFEYKKIDGDNRYTSAFSSSQAQNGYTNRAIFISNLYHITDSTLLESNLRYDEFDNFEDKTTYKIGLKQEFLDGFVTSANYYTSYDAPSTFQVGNTLATSLTPSYTKGYDISIAYQELLSITYFDNSVEDNIDYISNPVTFVGGYVNMVGETKFSGVEVKSQINLTDSILFSANYTHLIDYKDSLGVEFIRRAKDTLNASLDYYTERNMHFGINAQYIGDREDSFFDPVTFATLPVSTGNYTLWNLNFDMKIYTDTKLTINAKNIFDKEYASVYGYSSEGRSIYANIKYSF